MTKQEKKKQLEELGFECEIENGTLFIYKDEWDDKAEDERIYSLMSDYRSSYGVRPKKKAENKDAFEKYMNKPEVENG